MLQWAHRRKSFIFFWALGWLLFVPMFLLSDAGRDVVPPSARAVLTGIQQLTRAGSALLFVWSGDAFRQTRFVQLAKWRWAAGAAAWFAIAPIVLGQAAVVFPGYLLTATLLAVAGSMYGAVLIERRMIGAGLLAFVLFGLAISNLSSAVAPPLFGVRAGLTVLNVVLYAVCAFGAHLLIFEDMTYELRVTNRRLEAAQEELVQAAITDPLTGCHNRRFLEQIADRELQRHARFTLPLSILFIDIDRFKVINDTLGHDAGDKVLVYVARFLKRHIREADYVFRWGGDEFLVLITCKGEEAEQKAARLKAAFDAAPEAADRPPGIGLSVGWTEVPAGAKDIMPLVRAADERMYEDKRRR